MSGDAGSVPGRHAGVHTRILTRGLPRDPSPLGVESERRQMWTEIWPNDRPPLTRVLIVKTSGLIQIRGVSVFP